MNSKRTRVCRTGQLLLTAFVTLVIASGCTSTVDKSFNGNIHVKLNSSNKARIYNVRAQRQSGRIIVTGWVFSKSLGLDGRRYKPRGHLHFAVISPDGKTQYQSHGHYYKVSTRTRYSKFRLKLKAGIQRGSVIRIRHHAGHSHHTDVHVH